ncbi:TonB-dependent receptor [Tunicatimonas pelagia]|uniref:TonB-dependent receptor n=1 Tax=Tunicatimonas pelagia TaxID=931531 RepID=UPI00266550ED|nr:TonB-dependent receptor [Tunicatimonas pelagia]WKN43007.1 TonB-dependent receptor [Tunicatimonas pelagia]
MRILYVMLVVLVINVTGHAQSATATLRGSVTDNDGNGLPGINVQVKNTTLGAATDEAGEFEIKGVTEGRKTIVISSVGYATQTKVIRIEPDSTASLEVQLLTEAQELLEVTVSGAAPGFTPGRITGATKLPVDYQELPLSATVVQSDLIASRQFIRPETALRMVAGLTPVASAHSQTKSNFLARGFFHNSSLGGVLKDGKYYAGTDSPIADVASLDRIEFLKGASSLLYGSAEPGGQLNYVYKQPLEEAAYNINLLAGSWNTFRATLDAGGPIIADKLLYRATLGIENSETWQDFSYTERYAPMLTFLYKITPRTSLQLTGEMIIQDANPSNTDAPAINLTDADGSGQAQIFRVPDNWYAGFTNDYSEDLTQVYQASLRHEFSDNLNATANFSWNKSERESGAGGYFPLAGPENTFGAAGEPNLETGELNRLVFDQGRFVQGTAANVDVNYNGKTGLLNHRLIVGGSYTQITTQNRNGFSPLVPPGFVDEMPPTNIFQPVYVAFNHLTNTEDSPPFAIEDWDQEEYGVYLQDLIKIEGSGLNVMLGLRYNNYQYRSVGNTQWSGEEGSLRPDIDNVSLVPRLGLIYEFTPLLSAYGSFSQSILPIAPILGANGVVVNDNPEPVEGEQFEFGLKGQLAERLNYTVSLYQLDRQNEVVMISEDESAQDGLRRSRGVEVDASGQLFEGFNFYLSYGYTNTEIVESGVSDALEGERFSGVPEHFFSLWNTYQLPNRLGFGLGAEYRSSWQLQPGSFGQTVPLEEDSYFVVNASAFYQLELTKGALDFNLTVNNIFDEYYFLPTQSLLFIKRGAPLGYSVSVGYSF